ncbi:MAG: hypothetical protein N2257_00850 [Thermodesulfovibrionales bacterium]|nr:hypothetical protein [Thermodesulfovibrionales bacterium]
MRPFIKLFKTFLLIGIFSVIPLSGKAHGRLFIELSEPNPRPLLLGIQVYSEDSSLKKESRELYSIIANDLVYTGLFSSIDERLFLEPSQAFFKPENWKPLGADAVVKVRISLTDKILKAVLSLYDVHEGLQIMKKEYSGEITLLRSLGHAIARDVYKKFTDRDPPFEAKILYVGMVDGKKSLFVMDWDGARLRRLGITAETIISPCWFEEERLLAYTMREGKKWSIKVVDFNSMMQKTVFESQSLAIAGDFLDRKTLLLTHTESDNQDIFILDTETGKTKKLITGYGIDIDPAISPRKDKLLFVSDRSGSPQIYIAELSGYNIKRLTYRGNYNTSARWSPSGDSFIYVGTVNGKNQIFLQRFDSSEPVQLTDRGNNEEPSFSPDGRYITFSSDRDGTWKIYIMRLDGSGQKALSTGYGMSPVWIK